MQVDDHTPTQITGRIVLLYSGSLHFTITALSDTFFGLHPHDFSYRGIDEPSRQHHGYEDRDDSAYNIRVHLRPQLLDTGLRLLLGLRIGRNRFLNIAVYN